MAKKRRGIPRPGVNNDDLLVDPKFEPMSKKMVSETMDILASMVLDCLERNNENEKEQDT